MKKRLTHVNPVHAGKVLGALGALYSIFASLIFFVGIGIGMVTGNYPKVQINGLYPLVMLVLIPVIGFIYGFVGAAVFNFVAKMTGGVEFTVSDVILPEVPPWPAALPRYPFAPR